MNLETITLEELGSVDLDALSTEEQSQLLLRLRTLYADLEAREPDEESDEYEDWLNALDDLEEIMEEIQDSLEA